MSKRELRIDITGNADKFGEAAKKAQADINTLKSQGLDALTAGVYTGGAIAAATLAINAMRSVVQDIKQILERAERLNISSSSTRRLTNVGESIGLNVGQIDQGVQQARQARADALAGEPEAVRSFDRLKISLTDIAKLKPDELFYRILRAAQDVTLDAESYFAFSKLIGQGAADTVLPYARNPEALSRAFGFAQLEANMQPNGVTGSVPGLDGVRLGGRIADALGFGPTSQMRALLRSARQPFEPFSSFGIQNRDQTDDAAELNRQKLALVARAQLTTEERINEALAERARLYRLVGDEADPLKRQKLIGNLLNVEAEIGGLATKRTTELGSVSTGPSVRTQDPLRAIGADFSTFFVRRDMETGRQQVDELRRLRSTIAEGLQRVERAIGEELK